MLYHLFHHLAKGSGFLVGQVQGGAPLVQLQGDDPVRHLLEGWDGLRVNDFHELVLMGVLFMSG